MAAQSGTVASATSSTLYFGPWYRKSPMFEATLRAGCSAYDIYNHMYLPGYYDDPVTEYWALLQDVTLWDVGVERVVQISGPDAFELTNVMTCRDLTRCAVGQAKYALITAPDGGIVNDPVLIRRAEDTFWLCLADSDAHLYAMGIAYGRGMDVEVTLPRVHPVQVQGPKAKDVLRTLVGDAVLDVRYYWTMDAEIDAVPVVISRTGWTGEVGYEIYLTDPAKGDQLWQAIMAAGTTHGIRPIAPCEARRIEAGIFNYNSDITLDDNPYQVMGLEHLVEEQDTDYIGKQALQRIKAEGVSRRLVGIRTAGQALAFEIAEERPALHEGRHVGRVTDLVWSPRLESNIGYVWLPTELAVPGTPLQVEAMDGQLVDATTADIPFLDASKQVPAS